jgi:hypothetical protein
MIRFVQISICLIIMSTSLLGQGTGDTVRAIYVDDSDVIWLGTDLGLLSLDDGTWTAYNTIDQTPGDVTSLMFDGDGKQFWIGTKSGALLSNYEAMEFSGGAQFTNITVEEHEQPTLNVILPGDLATMDLKNIKDIAMDAQGNVFLLLDNGVVVQDKSEMKWLWLPTGYGIADFGVPNRELLKLGSEADTIYIGATGVGPGRLYAKTLKEGYRDTDLSVVETDEDIDAFTGASILYYPFASLMDDLVSSIYTDSEGYQWFGSYMGVSQHTSIDSKQGWDIRLSETDGLVNNRVNTIFEDSNGDFWFGTDGGISKYDGEFTNYTKSEGLADNMIFDIDEDGDGLLWFATANGVSSFNGSAFTTYTTSDHAKDFVNILKVGLEDFSTGINDKYQLYPNPTSSHVYVHFFKDQTMYLDVNVYDMSGKHINNLFSGYAGGGDLKVRWELDTESATAVPGGIYFITLQSDTFTLTKKLVVLQ